MSASLWFALSLAAPLTVPVAGALSTPTGAPVDGPHEVTFRLYSPSAEPELVWDDEIVVDFNGGAFAAHLDTDSAFFVDHGDLEITVALPDGEESARIPVAWAPYAARARYADEAGDAATLGGHPVEDFTLDAEAIAWSRLSNPPAGLADGDDDTRYTSGSGLALSGTSFSFNAATAEAAIKGVLADDYGFTAGAGLSLNGTSFVFNAATAEAAITGVLADDYVGINAPITPTASAVGNNAITVPTGRVLIGNGAGAASAQLELRHTTQEPFIALTRPTSGNEGGIHFNTGDSTGRKWTVKHPAGSDRLAFVDAASNEVLTVNQNGGITVPGAISHGTACRSGYTRCGRMCAKMTSTAMSVWSHQDTARNEGADVANYREAVEVAFSCAALPAFAVPNPGVWLSETCGDHGTMPRTKNLFLQGPALFTGCGGDSFDCYGIDFVACERIQSNPSGFESTGKALYVYRAEY
jgi:hypothetical protein